MRARPVPAAVDRLEQIGLRIVVRRDTFAILELRGGTHIVLRQLDGDTDEDVSFDLMVEDLDATAERFSAAGFEITPIQDGRIHRSFHATAPEHYRIQVLDSHAGDRVV
ncbi:MAG: VOC family protein [Deltaproteobacteria bacterium]|nr:VOC family protein [Deltaproteobacteria bacterium]